MANVFAVLDQVKLAPVPNTCPGRQTAILDKGLAIAEHDREAHVGQYVFSIFAARIARFAFVQNRVQDILGISSKSVRRAEITWGTSRRVP